MTTVITLKNGEVYSGTICMWKPYFNLLSIYSNDCPSIIYFDMIRSAVTELPTGTRDELVRARQELREARQFRLHGMTPNTPYFDWEVI